MNNFEPTSYFFDSIQLLRTEGDIILHSKFVQWSEDEEEYVVEFLSNEYKKERIHYPDGLPDFDKSAALWGAKITFISAQLLMLREVEGLDFNKVLPHFEEEMSISAILSADLCLKFLPEIIEKASDIDPYDELIEWLDEILINWPYSGIGRRNVDDRDGIKHLDLLKDHLMILVYSDRVVKRRAVHRIPQEIKEIINPLL